MLVIALSRQDSALLSLDELGVVDEPVQVLVVRGQDRVDQVHQLVVLSKVRAPKKFQL